MTNKNVATLCSLALVLLLSKNISFAQCIEDTHSANAADSWLSCQTSLNPNTNRGNSHWVMYDLGYLYTLGASTIWNYNVENETGQGFKDVFIDYSINGTDWMEVAEFELAEASGYSNYTGFSGFHFGEIAARYVLISAQNNWNGSNCAGISEFRVDVNIAALPIELLDFSARAKDDYIVLNWESVDELNFSHFEIERSIDGANFNFISKVQANNNDEINKYEKRDANVKKGQLYFYRLKMLNLDGTYEYSHIRTAQIGVDLEFSIYPNPTNSVLHISFKEELAKEIIIQNAAGHEMLRVNVNNEISRLDTSSLPAGMYLCSIILSDNTISTRRFVKM